MMDHLNSMKHWAKYGSKFEAIFYSDYSLTEKLEQCYMLDSDISQFKNSQPYNNNFITDLIHLFIRCVCLRKDEWVKNIDAKLAELDLC